MAQGNQKKTPEEITKEALQELPEAFRDIDLSKADGLNAGYDPSDYESEDDQTAGEENEDTSEDSTETDEDDSAVDDESGNEESDESSDEPEGGEATDEDQRKEEGDSEGTEEQSDENGEDVDEGEDESEEEKAEALLTLNYRGKSVDVPDTDEGKRQLANLAQKGMDYSFRAEAMKPWEKVIQHLYNNPEVRSQVEAHMRGEDVVIVPSKEETEYKDYVPSEQQDDETDAEYSARMIRESNEFYATKNRIDSEKRAKMQKVQEACSQDPLYQNTASLINQQVQAGAINGKFKDVVDQNPEAFVYVYDINRKLAFFNELTNRLKVQGKLDEVMSVMKQNPEDFAVSPKGNVKDINKAKKPPTTKHGKPNPKRPESKPPSTPKSQKRSAGPKTKGKIDWSDKDSIKGLSSEEILKIADRIDY